MVVAQATGAVCCLAMLPGLARRYVTQPVRRVLAVASPPPLLQSALSQEADRLRAELAAAMPGNPAASGFKTYSQSDEDGIIESIFARIGDGQRTFAEFGCGDGLENNSHLLLLKGWRGTWIDGNAKNIAFIAGHLPLTTARLSVIEAFVTRDNVTRLVSGGLERVGANLDELDLLSVDLDGNDLEILAALLSTASPRVLCVEYNAMFRPPLEIAVAYDPDHAWAGDDYHGASLAAFAQRLGDRYALVCCNVAGLNAFFVRSDLAEAFPAHPVEALYQPPRLHLAWIDAGHPPSLKFLAAALRD